MQCCRAYLSIADKGMKPQPPMGNIKLRKWKADMGDNFRDWAEGYFAVGGEHLDTELVKENVFKDYQAYSNMSKLTMQAFTKKLKMFCDYCPWVEELNPKDIVGDAKRYQKGITGSDGLRHIKDMIYIRSTAGANSNAANNATDDEFSDDTPF